MTRRPRRSAPFPDRQSLAAFVRANPRAGKREIARAFGLGAEHKNALKAALRELQDEGAIPRGRAARRGGGGPLPSVTVVEVTGTDADGELLARPLSWDSEAEPPTIYMAPERGGRSALGPGDRVLARLTPGAEGTYDGRTIRRIPSRPAQVLGIYGTAGGQGRLRPIDRRARHEYVVSSRDTKGAAPGELVRADVLPGRRLGLPQAAVAERLGSAEGPRSLSVIAIHDHGLPTKFTEAALDQAAAAGPAPAKGREDLRPLPLVTIDGADARDFDDAVWAEPDGDGANPGGWHLIVAIADVAWYVRPGDPLDACAYERGNSAYFPDRVVPMLPEALSNGWCSLKPDQERPCLAAHLWIDAHGALKRHRFARAVMRSAARLTYEQAQAARDGTPDDTTAPLMDSVIGPLFGAYGALAHARQNRGVLELELPERRVVLDPDGDVARIEVRQRFDSHRLIEEFMITANVAAAETLERLHQPCMYRVHDEPARDKLDDLRRFLGTLGLRLAKGQVLQARHFNQILAKAAETPHARLVNEVVLRSQAQAEYTPDNIGHFGLALRRYCHFTSPIRRYADLLVHRALIRGLGLGDGGLVSDGGDFEQAGDHISATERRAAAAERDAVDRFAAAYLADKVGARFTGRVTGVTRFGLFVTLDENGGDGLVPVSTLPADYYVHDEARHALVGRRTRRTWRLGQTVTVRLVEAKPVTGGLILNVEDGRTRNRDRIGA